MPYKDRTKHKAKISAQVKALQQKYKLAGWCRCGRKPLEGRTRCKNCAASVTANRVKARETLLTARNKPCTDCGTQYPPEIMNLDHVRGGKPIRVAFTRPSIPALVAEIAKCEVRCPLCHALRHYNEKHGTSLRVRTELVRT